MPLRHYLPLGLLGLTSGLLPGVFYSFFDADQVSLSNQQFI